MKQQDCSSPTYCPHLLPMAAIPECDIFNGGRLQGVVSGLEGGCEAGGDVDAITRDVGRQAGSLAVATATLVVLG